MRNESKAARLSHQIPAALFIVLVAISLGLAVHYPMLKKVQQGQSVHAVSTLQPTAQATGSADEPPTFPVPVDLLEVQRLMGADAVLVDARHALDYREGHLPGALSLPLGDFDTMLSDFKQDVSRDRLLILYCSGFNCHDSFDLGQRLIDEGYTDVRVFEGGVPQWEDAGLPLETEAP